MRARGSSARRTLAKRTVIDADGGHALAFSVTASGRLQMSSCLIPDAGMDGSHCLISSAMFLSPARCSLVLCGSPPWPRVLSRSRRSRWREALGAFLAVEMKPPSALSVARRGAACRCGGFAGGGIEDADGHGTLSYSWRLAVDAGADRQGDGMTLVAEPRRDHAPKPPAGPPAAITTR